MSGSPILYFDNAATSFPKPEMVYAEMDRYNRELGAAVGRGQHRVGAEVQSRVEQGRLLFSRLLNIEDPKQCVFTFNGTDSLNIALLGLLKPGDHVVTTQMEHNSVLRPLEELKKRQGIEVSIVKADARGFVSAENVREALRPETKLICLIHASNVSGTIQQVDQIGELAREQGCLFLLDAAQSVGHLPIDVKQTPVDLLACPGHKGLLGPLGTGFLYLRPGLEQEMISYRCGGTGTRSEDPFQPETMPEKFESGNHNGPGLFGLTAALEYVTEQTVEVLRQHEQELTAELMEGLKAISGLTLYGPEEVEERVGVVSFNLEHFAPQDLSLILDDTFGIQTRSGLHCAPGAHRALGTFETGGTVRLSPGPFSTRDDVEHVVSAIREIATAM